MPNLAGLRTLRALEHVDLDRNPRQSALMTFLALQDRPVALTTQILSRELHGAAGGSRSDHRLLAKMLDNRLIFRWVGAGRRPHLWAVNDQISEWRGVRWITPRRTVEKLLRAPMQGLPGPLWGQGAGQTGYLWGHDPSNPGSLNAVTSTNDVPTTAQHVPTTAQPPGLLPPECPHYGPELSAPSPCLEGSKEPSLTPGATEGEGKGEVERSGQAVELIEAVRVAMGKARIYGDPARRLAALADAHPSRLPLPAEFLVTLTGLVSPKHAVDQVDAYLSRQPQTPAVVHRGELWLGGQDPIEVAPPDMVSAALEEARKGLGGRPPKVG
jgi:hypothetical protein